MRSSQRSWTKCHPLCDARRQVTCVRFSLSYGGPKQYGSMRGRSPLHCGCYKTFQPISYSVKKASILTDSKSCVPAYEKLCHGEFSANPRVSTFLSVVSRYQASVRHVSGAAILPSDFASCNAVACENETCQVCSFIT